MHPLLVSATARSGSTILMKLLMNHPRIVGADLYPYETRPASYYASAVNVLSSRSDGVGIGIRDTFDENAHSISANPFHHGDFNQVYFGGDQRNDFYNLSVRPTLSIAVKSLIDEFYHRAAEQQHKSAPFYFAEKCDISRQSRIAMKALYPSTCEVVLVRDLRDVYCSAKKFFGEEDRGASINHISNTGKAILNARNNGNALTKFVKYENLVRDQTSVVEEIYQFLGLTPSDLVPSQERDMQKQHGTSASAEDSIGRWQHDLTEDEKEQCAKFFRKYLDTFEYD